MKFTEPMQPPEAVEASQPSPHAASGASEPPTPLSVRLAQLTLKRGGAKTISEPSKDTNVE